MGYSLDPLNDDCYENTTVLKNKFDIRDERHLDILERSITSMLIAKAVIDIPFENVNFDFYKNLHKYIFSDLYEWAGNIRKINMSKKGTNFCLVEKIEERGNIIFSRLIENDFMKQYNDDQLIEEK